MTERDTDDPDSVEAVSRLDALGCAKLAAFDPAGATEALRSARAMAQRLAGMGKPEAEPAVVYRPVGADGERGHE